MSHCHPLHSDQCKEFLLYLLRIKYGHHTYFHLKLYTSAMEDHCHITNIASSWRGESDYHKYGTRTCLSYTYDLMVVTNYFFVNFMVTPCINNIQHFNFQLTHTTLKNVELLKHFKISKTAPICFGLQGNHHQGATIST